MTARALAVRVGSVPLSVAAEKAFAVFTIYLLSGGPLPLGASGDAAGPSLDEGSLRFQILLSGIYLLALVLTLSRPGAWRRAVSSNLALFALLGWTVGSMYWSTAPEVTLRRALALVGTTFVGFHLATRYPLETQLRLVSVAIGLVVLYNIAGPLAQTGLTGDEFAGGFETKNSLGRMMALAAVVFVCLAWERRLRLVALAAACLSLFLVVVARSATALAVFLTTLALLPLYRLLKRDVRVVVVVGIVATMLVGIGVLYAAETVQSVASLLGRNATLTGRTSLWPLVWNMILRRPWLGYGYEAFWLWGGALRVPIDEAAGWEPAQAHNGFLDVALALGVVGFLFYAFVLVRGVIRAMRFMRQYPTGAGTWPLVYICFLFLYNITESTALARNSIFWQLYVAALVAVAPELPARGRARPILGNDEHLAGRLATRPRVGRYPAR